MEMFFHPVSFLNECPQQQRILSRESSRDADGYGYRPPLRMILKF